MANPFGVIIDRWSAIAHKAPMKDGVKERIESRMAGWEPANWTGEEHRRRLTAYMILSAYEQNSSRHFLTTTDPQDREDRREYGDAALVVEQTIAHLLGESQEVVVPGAEDYDPELGDPAQEPLEPAESDDDTPPEGPTPEEVEANAHAGFLADRQEFLREWADDVHLPLRLVDSARNETLLGDSAILLGWDDRKQRVVPSVMDPGFYFPVLPDTLDAYEYPERVHFAWELPGEDYADGKARVRRITYELGPLRPTWDEEALARLGPDDDVTTAQVLPDGARWVKRPVRGFPDVETEVLVREYPWRPGVESDVTCYVTDATWVLDDLRDAHKVDAFDIDSASIRYGDDGEVRDYDLGLDFLPIVHIPNTPPGGDHYGQSTLAKVLQILDDLQNADTDTQAASATTGSPMIGLSGNATMGDNVLTGVRGQTLEVRPGQVFRLGENGRADVIDTSANLAATREFVLHLLDRLSVNSRLPAAVLGRLKPSEVPSGFAMQLSFGPLTSMIRTMRLVRGVKYPLMLKMVQRIYQANGVLEPGETPRAEVQLGAYLPSDMAGTLAAVKDAYTAKVISLETAVTMLLEVGFPVDDVAAEIARIQSRDFDAADRLADATGDGDAVREYLGLEPAEEEPQGAPLVVQLPNQPPVPPVQP